MWNIIQCTVRGRSHIKEDIPCQDKICSMNSGDFVVSALADGAGSAKLSHFGAERVTQYMCTCMKEGFSEFYDEKDGTAFKHQIVSGIISELKELAEEKGCDVKDLASTLMVVSVKEDKYILLHIGDGVIGYLKKDGLKVASAPDNGLFANVTVFTTSENAVSKMKILKGSLGAIEGFVLMSDGSGASLYNKKERMLAPAVAKTMKLAKISDISMLEKRVAESLEKVIKTKTTDDCSIAIMMNDGNFHGYEMLDFVGKERLLGLPPICQMCRERRKNKRKKPIGSKAEIKRRRKERMRIVGVYDRILKIAGSWCDESFLRKRVKVKAKIFDSCLENLVSRYLMITENEKYKTAVVMRKNMVL